MINKIKELLLPQDSEYSNRIRVSTEIVRGYWKSMNKNDGAVWSDLVFDFEKAKKVKTLSSRVTASYRRLTEMALMYNTKGSDLYGDKDMLCDIITALDRLNADRYNTDTVESGNWWEWKSGNWWDWQIGTPLALNNCIALLYDELSKEQIKAYTDAVDAYVPTSAAFQQTGANRAWKALVVAGTGILSKNAEKISAAATGCLSVFDYTESYDTLTTDSDGFYSDGSFLQHKAVPNTGGYGIQALDSLARLMYILKGTEWEIKGGNTENIYNWVYNSFEPLFYKGIFMDMARGRSISRIRQSDRDTAVLVMESILILSMSAPQKHADYFNGLIKNTLEQPCGDYFLNNLPIAAASKVLKIKDNPNIKPRKAGEMYKQFPNMDRAVLRRKNYAFGISMYSKRIYNYESVNSENLKGWHTSDGQTYLYNSDMTQFNDAFWATVDPYRLPGITAAYGSEPEHYQTSNARWVGGAELGIYGACGMILEPVAGSKLKAKKSWFMFDETIAAIGSGIKASADSSVETIIENRKLNDFGSDIITNKSNWAHLEGYTPDSDIGYYFPQGGDIKTLKGERAGKWSDINKSLEQTDDTLYAKSYFTMWFDHTKAPRNANYAYVLLPGKTAKQVKNYSENPDITIITNTHKIHAVKDKKSGVTAANFFADEGGRVGIIRSDKPSCVIVKESKKDIEISVCNPTMIEDSVEVIVALSAKKVLNADSRMTALLESSQIKLTVDTSGARGKSFTIKLSK